VAVLQVQGAARIGRVELLCGVAINFYARGLGSVGSEWSDSKLW